MRTTHTEGGKLRPEMRHPAQSEETRDELGPHTSGEDGVQDGRQGSRVGPGQRRGSQKGGNSARPRRLWKQVPDHVMALQVPGHGLLEAELVRVTFLSKANKICRLSDSQLRYNLGFLAILSKLTLRRLWRRGDLTISLEAIASEIINYQQSDAIFTLSHASVT